MRIENMTLSLLLACASLPALGISPSASVGKLSARSAVELQRPERLGAPVWVYLTLDPASDAVAELARIGMKATALTAEYATARVERDKLEQLANVPGVRYVEISAPAHQTLDVARPETGASAVHADETVATPWKGAGVIVGVVDAGFDFCHAAFKDGEGQLRISRVWIQGDEPQDGQASPEKFGYGCEYTTSEGILGALADVYNNSHGTHVAAIAAGSDPAKDGAYTGMAPESEIVLVGMGDITKDNVNISNAIAYIFDYAEAQGKPCVVNLSLGSHSGPHDGTSAFDRIADSLQGPGRLIVGSSGNNRADKFHVGKELGEADATLQTLVDFRKSVSNGGDIEVWGSEGLDIEVWLQCVNILTGELQEEVKIYPGEAGSASFSKNISGEVTYAGAVDPINSKSCVQLSTALKSLRTNYGLALSVKRKSGSGRVDIWTDNGNLGLTAGKLNGYLEPEEGMTVAEIGGTAKRILTVGAYATRPVYTLFNETAEKKLSETEGALASFSSMGPTADGRVKPEVTAPGAMIASAVSNYDGSGTLQIAYSHTEGEREHMYGYMQGTSMASPMVAGAVALWLQANPELTPELLKRVVAESSRHDSHTGELPEADNGWGHGKLDVAEGLRRAAALSGIGLTEADKSFAGLLRYRDGQLEADMIAGEALLRVYSLDGRLLATGKGSLSVAHLERGAYIAVAEANGIRTTMKIKR